MFRAFLRGLIRRLVDRFSAHVRIEGDMVNVRVEFDGIVLFERSVDIMPGYEASVRRD